MMLYPSVTHALMLYSNVQGETKPHDDEEQHNWESNTPFARMVEGVAPGFDIQPATIHAP